MRAIFVRATQKLPQEYENAGFVTAL